MAICVLSLAVCRRSRSPGVTLDLTLMALPVYVAFQLAPLPLAWLRSLSPARADMLSALTPLGLGATRASLSASPSLTETHLLRLIGYICVFFLIRELSRRFAERVWVVALPVVAIGAAEAMLGMVQYFGGASRASGTYVNPNHFSCLLQMTLPFPLMLAAMLLRKKRAARRDSFLRTSAACALLALGVLIFLGVLDSLSRMGLVALAASLLCLVMLFPLTRGGTAKFGRWYGYVTAAALVIVIALAIFFSTPAALLERLQQQDTHEPLTAEARVAIWRETLPMVADFRIFGSGLGTYASVFQKYRSSSPEYLVDFAHNDYLQLVAELGLVGFTIALVPAVLILGRIGRTIVGAPSESMRLIAAASVVALLALMLDSSVDFDFYIPANAMMAAWIAGIGAAAG